MSSKWRRRSAVPLLAVLVVVTVVYFVYWRDAPRNFGVVKEGTLYRSGQLTPRAFSNVLADYRIKTVVTLRYNRGDEANSDVFEEEICRSRGVKYIRIPPPSAEADDVDSRLGPVVDAFLRVMDDDANHPVLVHCTAGRDRTGTVCAAYRIEFDRWPPKQALDEMCRFKFDPARDEAAGAFAQYVLSYRRRGEPSR